MLNKLRCHAHFLFPANQITWSEFLTEIHIFNDKQCRSKSVGFFRSQLIWIYTVCYDRHVVFSKRRVKLNKNDKWRHSLPTLHISSCSTVLIKPGYPKTMNTYMIWGVGIPTAAKVLFLDPYQNEKQSYVQYKPGFASGNINIVQYQRDYVLYANSLKLSEMYYSFDQAWLSKNCEYIHDMGCWYPVRGHTWYWVLVSRPRPRSYSWTFTKMRSNLMSSTNPALLLGTLILSSINMIMFFMRSL